nr:hypothetical protein [uncultured Sphingomonas sp.]
MAAVAVMLPVTVGGRAVITMNFCGRRTGSNNDRHQFRIIRRASGQPDVQLVGIPDVTLTSSQDTRSWTWVDDNITFSGNASYYLQIKRVVGLGVIDELVLLGQFYKR